MAEKNSKVIIKDHGVEIGRADVDADGKWVFTPMQPLLNGSHAITATAVDASGNVGTPSAEFDFQVFTGGVATATAITAVIDDVGENATEIQPNGSTNDKTPTVVGTAQAGAHITLLDENNQILGTATAGADGRWIITTPELSEGTHTLTATSIAANGDIIPPTGPYTISIDITPPAPPLGTLIDNVEADVGPITEGSTTNDATPTFKGTAVPNGTVTVYDGIVKLATVSVDADGNWSYTPVLEPGPHSFVATATDPDGNTSQPTSALHFTVDTSNVPIAINQVLDLVGDTTGPLQPDGYTDDPSPVVSGKARPGGMVTLYDGDGTVLGVTFADVHTGEWTIPVQVSLLPGLHNLTATVTTSLGESAPTAAFPIHEVSRPDAPVIVSVKDDVGVPQGLVASGQPFDDNTPTISGTSTPGSEITLYDDGKYLGTTMADATGTWVFTPESALNLGTHPITATATDAAGKSSAPSAAWNVVVDTSGALMPDGSVDPRSLATIAITHITADTGVYDNDFNTFDTTLVLGGTSSAADGSRVELRLGGVHIGYSTVVGGVWTFDYTSVSLASGYYNSHIDVLLNGVHLGYTTVVGGVWTYDYTGTTLGSGVYQLQADLVDLAGNIAVASAVQQVIVDPSGATLPGGAPDPLASNVIAVGAITIDSGVSSTDFNTNDQTLVFSGSSNAADGSHVDVLLNGVHLGYTTVVGGVWTYDYTSTTLDSGVYQLQADLVDLAGNIAVVSAVQQVIVDPSGATLPGGAPDPLATRAIGIAAITIDSGVSSTDFNTNDQTLIFSGSSNAADGTYVDVLLNGVHLGYVTVISGAWAYDYRSVALDSGIYQLQANLVDAAGNIAVSSTHQVIVDPSGATLPGGAADPLAAASIAVTGISNDTGSSGTDFLTNDSTLAIHGSSSAANGSYVDVFVDGTHVGYTTVNGGGWDYDYTGVSLSSANHTLSASLVDAAGNVAVSSAVQGVVIDTTRPDLTISGTQSGTLTGPTTYNFAFTEAVTGFTLSDIQATNATLSGFTRIDATHYSVLATPTGSGSGSLTLSVASGSYSDNAGNSNSASDSISQAYSLSPADIDLGAGNGWLIDGWLRPGTNEVWYYWDVNGDKTVDSYNSSLYNSGPDSVNNDKMDGIFNGGANTTDGRYTAVMNGKTVTFAGIGDAGFVEYLSTWSAPKLDYATSTKAIIPPEVIGPVEDSHYYVGYASAGRYMWDTSEHYEFTPSWMIHDSGDIGTAHVALMVHIDLTTHQVL